jgi:uncharacterized protein YdaU (DUF1376 family)
MSKMPRIFEPNAKALFQKWDEPAFRSDTVHLHWMASQFYRCLLQFALISTTRPDLPADEDQLRRILGGVPEDIWAQHRDEVLSMFLRDEVNGVKVLYQKRLRKDWAVIETYRKEQRDKANKRWEKSQKQETQNSPPTSKDATAMPGQCRSDATAMPGSSNEVVGISHEEEVVVVEENPSTSSPSFSKVKNKIATIYKKALKHGITWREAETKELERILLEFAPQKIVKAWLRYLETGDVWDKDHGFPFSAFSKKVGQFLVAESDDDDDVDDDFPPTYDPVNRPLLSTKLPARKAPVQQ